MLNNVRHLSFDVWNTLIAPNPEYTDHRTEYLSRVTGKDCDDVRAIYTKTKKYLDHLEEGVSHRACYDLLAQNLGLEPSDQLYQEWSNMFIYLFKFYRPLLLPGMKVMLHDLVDKGYTVSIGSNTNFISGSTMEAYLRGWRIPFQYYVFSDLVGVAKPSPKFFDHIIHGAFRMNKPVEDKEEILHIGDSPRCDMLGSTAAGLQGTLILNPSHLIMTLGPK